MSCALQLLRKHPKAALFHNFKDRSSALIQAAGKCAQGSPRQEVRYRMHVVCVMVVGRLAGAYMQQQGACMISSQ